MKMKAFLLMLILLPTMHAQHAIANSTILSFPQPQEAPDEVYVLIEIPAGSTAKYEIDAQTGFLFVDRFQSMPVVYPANYGTLPSTLAGDQDPLDALVYSREPIVPGALIKVRPIGILHMLDAGEEDDKLVVVPTTEVDPTFANINNITDLPAIERERLLAFFRIYKDLPAGRKEVKIDKLEGRKKALAVIRAALAAYNKQATPAESPQQ